ncbi:MAG TPA: hypothetical protein VIR13_01230 [Savagea sp.]
MLNGVEKKRSNKKERNSWIEYLHFGFKKAKHFCTYEVSFTDYEEIEVFEADLEKNLDELHDILEELSNEGVEKKQNSKKKDREGKVQKLDIWTSYIYFYPKANDEEGKSRLRPKVYVPFAQQVLWAAFILRVGEYFDTNENMKIVASSHDPKLRNLHDWMVPWSVNNRLKRMKQQGGEEHERGFLHFNSPRLYESHQFSLRKHQQLYIQSIEELFAKSDKVYEAEIDIKEFYPSVTRAKVKEAFQVRYEEIKDVPSDEENSFHYDRLFNNLLDRMKVKACLQGGGKIFNEAVDRLMINLREGRGESKEEHESDRTNEPSKSGRPGNDTDEIKSEIDEREIEEKINDSLYLDHIASGFLSNLVLNHYVDRALERMLNEKNQGCEATKIIRYTDDYVILSRSRTALDEVADQLTNLIKGEVDLEISASKSYLRKEELIALKEKELKNKYDMKIGFKKLAEQLAQKEMEERVKEIDRNCSVFSIENVMDNISMTADVKMHAMTDKELTLYLKDLLFYFTLNEDVRGLKVDTLQLFSAWRLNGVVREKNSRYDIKMEDVQSILCSIEKAIKISPYKISLYQAYMNILLYLISENDEGYKEVEHFLVKVPSFMNEENYSVYGTVVREHILYMFHRYFRKFDVAKKREIELILKRIWKVWYPGALNRESYISWTEQYSLLRTYLMMGLAFPVAPMHHEVLKRLLTLRDSEKEGVETVSDLFVRFLLLKETIYRDANGNLNFTQKESLLSQRLRVEYTNIILTQRINTEEDKKKHMMYGVKIYSFFLRELEVKDYRKLSKVVQHTEKVTMEEVQQFYYDALFNSFREKDSSFTSWVESLKGKEGVDSIQALKTLSNLEKIRHYFSNTDPEYMSLPQNEEGLKVPFIDYLIYVNTLPKEWEKFKLRQDLLHIPLEKEIVKFISAKAVELRGTTCSYLDILYSEFNVTKLIKEEHSDINVTKLIKEEHSDVNVTRHIKEEHSDINVTRYIKEEHSDVNVTRYIKEEHGDTNVTENIKEEQGNENYEAMNQELARALFAALAVHPYHPLLVKKDSEYKWYGLDILYRLTNYASSDIVTYIAQALPIHNRFYTEHYQISITHTPYPHQHNVQNFKEWALRFLKGTDGYEKEHFGNRKFELRVIDMDGGM